MEERAPVESHDGTDTIDFPRLGHLFRSRRLARRLRIVELARQAGLRDNARVLRQIDRLEKHGLAPLHLVESLCAFFRIELQEARKAWKLDEADRKRLRWESTGGRPYIVVRFMASVYRQSRVPEGLEGPDAIRWAQAYLRDRWESRFLGCVVLSPDEIAWFQKDGTCQLSRDIAPPSISVRGRRFMFTD